MLAISVGIMGGPRCAPHRFRKVWNPPLCRAGQHCKFKTKAAVTGATFYFSYGAGSRSHTAVSALSPVKSKAVIQEETLCELYYSLVHWRLLV